MPETVISVVTPTLNAERYLGQCLKSVVGQGWPAVEHLVVDGGSTDATERIARGAGAIWIQRPGLGQAAAVNRGVQAARGEVIGWLNADDLYTPGTFQCIASAFARDPDLDVVIGDCDLIDASGRELRRLTGGPYDFKKLLRGGNSLAQPSVFLRRRVFDAIGYLDESLEFAMDYDLWLRLRGLRVQYLPRVFAQFRWRVGSKTATHPGASWDELMRVVRRHGGRWTAPLVWAFMRAHLTRLRQRLIHRSQDPT